MSNPGHWAETPAQAAATETFRITHSEYFKERVTACCIPLEDRLFDPRLSLVTGIRYEKTEDDGRGMLLEPDLAFQRNADGSFVCEGAGNILNEPQRLERYGDLTPDYAGFHQDEEFGVQMSAGVKGT